MSTEEGEITVTDASEASERRRLWIIAALTLGYLGIIGAGAVVGALLLLDSTRNDDLRDVAALALIGGALGATARAMFEAIDRIGEGWELSDGTIVRRSEVRAARAREAFLQQRGLKAIPNPQPSTPAAYEAQQLKRDLWRAEHDAEWAQVFSVYTLPFLLALPLIGAALGLIAFAGVVGGFLVATGDQSPDYSPAGLLFIAALSGMFANNFIASLARGAKAIFGEATTSLPRPPSERDSHRDVGQ